MPSRRSIPVIASCRHREPSCPALPLSRRTVTPKENARGKREKTLPKIPSPSDLCRATVEGALDCHASISVVDLLHHRTELWNEGSERDGKGRHLLPLSRRQSHVTVTNLCLLVKVTVGPSKFLAAIGAAAGSARDCGCSILLLCRIELSGLLVAIKAVSAIAEVSRPAIEVAIGFERRGMVLVTPLVYGFNFRVYWTGLLVV
ncbi:uncharacterized protein DS421_16g543060 [Arachis hypogaea]|nr:uncharacterized protein DS421_16g543060 [Arachis hypogaea]